MDSYRGWASGSGKSSSSNNANTFQRDKKGNNVDAYDFDISQDDYSDSSPEYSRAPINRRGSNSSDFGQSQNNPRFAATRRSLTLEERASMYLEKSKALAKSSAQEEETKGTSLEAEYAELLKDLPKATTTSESDKPKLSKALTPQGSSKRMDFDSPSESILGESFDISAADLEVGAIAAKRSKEKASDRRRRMSFDQETFNSKEMQTQAKNSASPDVMKFNINRRIGADSIDFPQMSTALSSIQRSRSFSVDNGQNRGKDAVKFGSLDKSADEIYRMLNISTGNDSDGRLSKFSNIDRDRSTLGRSASELSDVTNQSNQDFDFRRGANTLTALKEDTDSSYQKSSDNFFDREETFTNRHSPRSPKEEEDVYADDFETDQNISIIHSAESPVAKQVAASNKVYNDLDIKEVKVSTQAISSVDEIMERWYKNPSQLMRPFDEIKPSLDPVNAVSDSLENGSTSISYSTPTAFEAETPQVAAITEPEVPNLDMKLDSTVDSAIPPPPPPQALLSAMGSSNLVSSVSVPIETPHVLPSFEIPTWSEKDILAMAAATSTIPRSTEESDEKDDDFSAEEDSTYERYEDRAESIKSPNHLLDSEHIDKTDSTSPHSNKDGVPDVKQPSGNARSSIRSSRYEDPKDNEDPDLSINQRVSISDDESVPKKKENEKFHALPMNKTKQTRDNQKSALELISQQSKDKSNKEVRVSAQSKPISRFAPSTAAKIESRKKSQTQAKLTDDSLIPRMTRRATSPNRPKSSSSKFSTPERRGNSKKERERLSSHTIASANRISQSLNNSLALSQPLPRKPDRHLKSELLHRLERFRQQRLNVCKENYSEWEDIMQLLMEELAAMDEREERLFLREKAVAFRENHLETKERTLRDARGYFMTDEVAKLFAELQAKNSSLEKELSSHKEREADMNIELDRLRAELFDWRQSSNGNGKKSSESDNAEHLEKLSAHKSFDSLLRSLRAKPIDPNNKKQKPNKYFGLSEKKEANEANGSDQLVVERKEFEDLLRDYASQDRIISGFQKENERLAKALKDREVEGNARRSLFLEQQEALNKELNRLRNANRINPGSDQAVYPSAQKTADQLRLELELDAKIRFLQEKLAANQAESGDRERSLMSDIEKLRRENADLMKANTKLTSRSMDKLELDLKLRDEEILRLKQKIQWHLDNQKLLDEVDKEASRQRQKVYLLKSELVSRGLAVKAVNKLLERVDNGPGVAVPMDTSLHDKDKENSDFLNETSKIAGKANRSFADIKKIRELEKTVRELQETLVKRYPDSVAGLIHASKVTDIQQERQCRVLEAKVSELEEELASIQSQQENRLRSLRLEHEKMKDQYTKTIKDQEEQLRRLRATKAGNLFRKETPGGGEGSEEITNLSDALLKISDLQSEVQRLRSFYTKKIEDIQRKSEMQLRAIKRGEHFADNSNPPPSLPAPAPAPAPAAIAEAADEKLTKELTDAVTTYKERLSLLETELMSSAQEVGHWKATAQASQQALLILQQQQQQQQQQRLLALPPETVPSPDFIRKDDVQNLIENRLKDAIAAMESESRRERDRLEVLYKRRVEESSADRATSETTAGQHQIAVWLQEKERLIQDLSSEKAHSASLQQEILRLQKLHMEPKSPSLLQLQIVERQLQDVEQRMHRRERELMSVVDEIKSSAKIERSMLQSLHAQELREKDQQLALFQLELERLLVELNQWHRGEAARPLSVATDALRSPASAVGANS